MQEVTVIIPVYNNESIIESLKSKISFLNDNFSQIVIVDDCSQDNVFLNLSKFISEKKLVNVEIYKNEKNMGPSYSRNVGLRLAKGEYIAFLDSDDEWHPQKIDIQVEAMQKYNVKISGTVHKVISYDELDDEKKINYSEDNVPYIDIKWPKILFISPFATPSVVIHRDIKGYLFDDALRYSEDYDLWKRITYKHKGIKIQLPLTFTFKHDYISNEKTLSTNLKEMQRGVEVGFKKLLDIEGIGFGNKILIVFAILFSKIKYLRRVLFFIFKS